VTDSRGQYRLPVRTGAFHLTAALQGFAAPARTFELLLGQEATVNLVMSPSTLQETVTVTGDSPLVDFNQSKLGGNIDPRQMQELPVNGRNWQDLAVLSPGSRTNAVTADSPTVIGSNSNTQVGSYQLNLDGQQVTNNVLNGNGNPRYSRDAIAEFELITNRFDATQGRSTGVQVNAITKSGTNTPAGTFSGYFRQRQIQCGRFGGAPRCSLFGPANQHDLWRSDSEGQDTLLRELRIRTRAEDGRLQHAVSKFQPGSREHQAREQVSRASGLPAAISEPFDDALYEVEQSVAARRRRRRDEHPLDRSEHQSVSGPGTGHLHKGDEQ
jgi:hypothetical protein